MSDRARGKPPPSDRRRSRSRSNDRYTDRDRDRDSYRDSYRDRRPDRRSMQAPYDQGRYDDRDDTSQASGSSRRSFNPRDNERYRDSPNRMTPTRDQRPNYQREPYDNGRGGYGDERDGGGGLQRGGSFRDDRHHGGRGGGGYGDRDGHRGGGYGDRGGHRGGGYGDRGGHRGGGYGDRDGHRGGGYGDRGGHRGGGYGDRGGHRGGGFSDRGGHRGGGGGGFGGPPRDLGPPRKEPQPVELLSNYFEITSKPDWLLYQYHVDFDPDIQSKKLKFGLLSQHRDLFNGNLPFDGTTLYSVIKLPQETTELVSIRNNDKAEIKIKIKLTKQLTTNTEEALRFFNIIFKRCLKRVGLVEFGKDRAYFDFSNMHRIDQFHLNIASGYKASIDIHGERLLLCMEIAHKLLNLDTVLDRLNRLYQQHGAENFRETAISELVGQTVMTNYNKKTYRIDDINFDLSPSDSFAKRNGDSTTFVEYYQQHYGLRIEDRRQPMLVIRPKERDLRRGQTGPILLIPELCILTGTVLLKGYERDFSLKRDIDAITKLNPDRRHPRLTQFLSKVTSNQDSMKDLKQWNIDFESDLVSVTATWLPEVAIKFGADKKVEKTERGWNNALKDSEHVSSVDLKSWILIYMPRDENKARELESELISVSRPMNFKVNNAYMLKLPDVRGGAASLFANSIKEAFQDRSPQMVVCLVPSASKDTYDAIKRVCCIDYGLPSQVVTSGILNVNNPAKTRSVITKVAIQMNCKLGGRIWTVTMPLSNTMIVGIDVVKDSSSRGTQKVVAFISTLNGTDSDKQNCSKYYSKCLIEQGDSLYLNCLEVLTTESLHRYYDKNGSFPEKIIVYRDGVSDGQFNVVKEHEIPQMDRAIASIKDYNPKITFLVVKKRGNARFFTKEEFAKNPPIGTVIDSVVTKTKGEFYLISQSANQGTVSPTHFHILKDTLGMDKQRIQQLTYILTHLYYNWPGQLRVPAICQYATKLGRLVGESLHAEPSKKLEEKLYYL